MSTQGNVADYLINRSTCVAHSNNDSAADVATQTTHFHEHALFLADFFFTSNVIWIKSYVHDKLISLCFLTSCLDLSQLCTIILRLLSCYDIPYLLDSLLFWAIYDISIWVDVAVGVCAVPLGRTLRQSVAISLWRKPLHRNTYISGSRHTLVADSHRVVSFAI